MVEFVGVLASGGMMFFVCVIFALIFANTWLGLGAALGAVGVLIAGAIVIVSSEGGVQGRGF